MKINLTKLLDIATKTIHVVYDPYETTDGFYYVSEVEGTSPKSPYSFELVKPLETPSETLKSEEVS